MKSAAAVFTIFVLTIVSSIATESPEEEPVMISVPSNLKLREGDEVQLPCKVKNRGIYVRIWKKLPNSILFAESVAVSSDSRVTFVDDSLQIKNLTPAYSGTYVCQVSKHPVLRVVHQLEVQTPASVSPDPPEGKVIFRKGESASILCNPSGSPKPHITWTYGDEQMQGSAMPRGVRQVHGSELHFSSVDVNHAGIYKCVADNEVGEKAVATFNLSVQYAPELLVKPEWSHGDKGASVEFVCTCRSWPLSDIAWLQGDHRSVHKLENEKNRVRVRTRMVASTVLEYSLRIQRLRKEDLGQYTCVAKNVIGQSWKTVEISGLAEPAHLQGDESGEGSFLLKWTAKSYSPIIEYTLKIRKHKSGDHWNDVTIPAINQDEGQGFLYSQSYNVTGLQPHTRYEAVLHAHNDFGWNRPSDTFLFGEEPPPIEPEDEEDIQVAPSLLPLYEAELDVTDPTYLERSSAAVGSRTIFSAIVYGVTVLFIYLRFCVS